MTNYKKSLASVATKTFALFVIVSILLPLPVVNVVYAQVADAVVAESATATSEVTAAPAPISTDATVVTSDTTTKADAAASNPVSSNGGNTSALLGGPTLCEQVDVNHDGVLDNNDFITFQSLYAAQNPVADFNHDGQFNVVDFQDFLNAFNGCHGSGSIPVCVRADMNNDGQLTPADFPAFETAYNGQEGRSDFDLNGFFNVNDFQAFLNAYASCTHQINTGPVCARVDINNDGVLTAADFSAFQTAYDNREGIADFDQNGSYNANDFQSFINAFAECGGNNSNPSCARADMNHDGELSVADFTAFETAYNANDMAADFDLNNSLNANDFQSFMNAYAVCPHTTATAPHNGNITVSPISGTTTETGGSVTISVALGTTPTAPVTLNLSSSDTAEGTVSTGTLTFDASHMVQSFVVTGVDDSLLDGDQNYAVVFAPTISTDLNYNNVHVNNVPLINIDNGTHPTNGGGGNGGGGSGGGSGGFSSFSGGSGFGGVNGEVLGASTINPMCNYLGAYLKRGDNNDRVEVMKLQSFLKTSEGFTNLQVNGIFDDATFAAVSAFQKKYSSDVLNPWGYSADQATGYVYILTKNKVNELFCRSEIVLTPAQKDEINSFRASRALAMTDEVSKKKLITN